MEMHLLKYCYSIHIVSVTDLYVLLIVQTN